MSLDTTADAVNITQVEVSLAEVPLDEFTLADLEGIEVEIEQVKRAIELMDADAYGICEICTAQIPDHYLDENPLQLQCPTHLFQ